jgi:hypothetical protein
MCAPPPVVPVCVAAFGESVIAKSPYWVKSKVKAQAGSPISIPRRYIVNTPSNCVNFSDARMPQAADFVI